MLRHGGKQERETKHNDQREKAQLKVRVAAKKAIKGPVMLGPRHQCDDACCKQNEHLTDEGIKLQGPIQLISSSFG